MIRFAKPLLSLAFWTAFGGLVSCDRNSTAPDPTPRGQDTLKAIADSNDVLERALPLALDPSWIPVRPVSPEGWPSGYAWFSLDVDSGWTYQITLRDSSSSSASIQLFDGDSSLLRNGTWVTGMAGTRLVQIQYETDRSQVLYLVVNGRVRAPLELGIEVLAGQEARPDAFELHDSSSELRGGPSVFADSTWINRTLHRTAGGTMESGDLFQIAADSGKLYTIHLHARGNAPTIEFLARGFLPIDTVWTHTTSRNTRVATLTFAAYRSGPVHFAAVPAGPDFKPVHYRVAATARDGIPSGVYPDAHEPDNIMEFASLLFPDGKAQSRTLHRDRGVSDTDEVFLLNPTGSVQILEIHDSLQALAVEAFSELASPLALVETATGSVRWFVVPASGITPIRIRLVNRTATPAAYRITLRAL